jgi:hypothetical protein
LKKLFLLSFLILSILFANETLLERELIANICDTDKVKELINKGVNKDLEIVDNGLSIFVYSAAIGDKGCAETAHYLSSIGAKDTGLYREHYEIHKYEKPKIVETEHLRLIIADVDISGGTLNAVLENKTDELIYMKGQSMDINGAKDFLNDTDKFKDLFVELNPHNKTKDRQYHLYSPLSFCNEAVLDEDAYKIPRVVDNKIRLVRQYTLTYEYKGETYELITPVMHEEFEVKYAPYNLLNF